MTTSRRSPRRSRWATAARCTPPWHRSSPAASTNLHGGWTAGAATLLPQAKEAALARVILLSDGNANVGETTEPAAIAALCAEAAAQGVTTSTYGLGEAFNEDLMVAMAQQGNGNPYYGATAADLFEPFAEEFDLIANLYARHVRLSLTAPEGVKITLCNDYPVEKREGFPAIRLPDIPFGAEAWVLLELEIGAGLALESGNNILQAGVTGATPEGVPIAFTDALLTMKALSPPAWEALLPDPLVLARQAEVEAGKLLAAARAAAEHGDWKAIERILADAKVRFADHPWVIDVLDAHGRTRQGEGRRPLPQGGDLLRPQDVRRGCRPSSRTSAASPTRPRHRASCGARPRRGRRSSRSARTTSRNRATSGGGCHPPPSA